MLQSSAIERSVSDSTHLWKCQLAKNKELLIPPIWDCCGPTEGSFFTHGQIKNPAFFEGRCFTGKMIRQMWAESAVCLNSYLWRGWIFYLSMGKKWTPSRSTTTPDRWYQKFFIFGQLTLPMMCVQRVRFSLVRPITHTNWKCQSAKKKNFWYHLSGVVVDLLELHFLPIAK